MSIAVHLPGTNFAQMMRKTESFTGSKLLRYFSQPRSIEFDNLKIIDYFQQYHLQPFTPSSVLKPGQFMEELNDAFPHQVVIK